MKNLVSLFFLSAFQMLVMTHALADTKDASIAFAIHGGAGTINQGVTGSYGGGEDFGSPFTDDYKGNVVVNNQQIQQQNQAARDRYDQMFGEDAGI